MFFLSFKILTSTCSPLRGFVMFVVRPGVKVTVLASPSLSASLVLIKTFPSSVLSTTVTILAARTASTPSLSSP